MIGALQLELSATPILVLGQSLRRQRDVFYIHEMGHLQAISSSAHRIVATFLSTPSAVAVHLPTTSYTILWYGLLVLSKLSLLFPNDTTEPFGVDNKKIRNVGVAIMQRIGSFSQGGDVWENSKKVIGSMLLWLEKSNPETRQMVSDNASPTVITKNASGHVASDQAGPNPLLEASEDVDIHQEILPVIDNLGHFDSAAYIEDHAAMDWDASLWQGMLESLPWFSTSMDGPSVFQ